VGKTGYDLPQKAQLFGGPNLAQPTHWLHTKKARLFGGPGVLRSFKFRGTSKTGKLAENRRFFDKQTVRFFGLLIC